MEIAALFTQPTSAGGPGALGTLLGTGAIKIDEAEGLQLAETPKYLPSCYQSVLRQCSAQNREA